MWPENWQTASLFAALGTQWNTGFSGATGLNYLVVFELLDRQGLTGDDWQAAFAELRAMEGAALTAMQEK